MADVWDIARFVEEHPNNHAQRWRLVKKLYLAWEYRLALEHLLILQNEDKRKVNVVRYLAATYYRLSRYEDAMVQLDEAIESWPEDVGILEQMARTLEKADRKMEAADVWQKIAEGDMEHRAARRHVKRLRDSVLGKEDPHSTGPELSSPKLTPSRPEIVCHSCNARNAAEFERCWRCHSPLMSMAILTPLLPQGSAAARRASELSPIIIGISAVVFLSFGVFMTIQVMFPTTQDGLPPRAASTMYGFLTTELAVTRIILGLLLLAAWPLAMRLAISLADVDKSVRGNPDVLTVALATFTYAVSWVPPQYAYLVIVLPGLAALLLMAMTMGLRLGQVAMIWLAQGTVLSLVIVTMAAAIEGFDFIADMPAMYRHAAQGADLKNEPLVIRTPLDIEFHLDSSGARWLDDKAGTIQIEFITPESAGRLRAQLHGHESILLSKELRPGLTRVEVSGIKPEATYGFLITGEKDVEVRVEFLTPLKFVLESEH